LITCLFLLFNPEVLYGLKGIWIISQEEYSETPKDSILYESKFENAFEKSDPTPEKLFIINEYASSANHIREKYLGVREVENMEKVISNYMNETKAYLEQGFSLPQLAKATNFQLQQVSAFLNQRKGENFNDYINKFRVNHLIGLYEQDATIIDQFTLEHLGKESGFGSRSAFITSFKKFTGQTPSAYFKP
jgi:YesN/AraC family two-component response regulator